MDVILAMDLDNHISNQHAKLLCCLSLRSEGVGQLLALLAFFALD
jgi:hypothetical protein